MMTESWIQIWRGVAIIFMVVGHVIGTDATVGVKVDANSGWRYFYFSFQYLTMPLFAAISGYVYSIRPVVHGQILRFVKGKARRLLLPLVVVSTIQYLLMILVPGVNRRVNLEDMWRIYFFSFDQFWFLQALFGTFLLIIIIELSGLLNHLTGWLLVFCLVLIGSKLVEPLGWSFFSFPGFLYIFPFFLLGCGLKRHADKLYAKLNIVLVGLIFIVAIIAQHLAWHKYLMVDLSYHGILARTVGLSGVFLLLAIKLNAMWLASIGSFSFGIFLYHVFFAAASRIFLVYAGTDNQWLLFVAGVISGVCGPIVFEMVVSRNYLCKRVLFG